MLASQPASSTTALNGPWISERCNLGALSVALQLGATAGSWVQTAIGGEIASSCAPSLHPCPCSFCGLILQLFLPCSYSLLSSPVIPDLLMSSASRGSASRCSLHETVAGIPSSNLLGYVYSLQHRHPLASVFIREGFRTREMPILFFAPTGSGTCPLPLPIPLPLVSLCCCVCLSHSQEICCP
jgi:hypothetical protein